MLTMQAVSQKFTRWKYVERGYRRTRAVRFVATALFLVCGGILLFSGQAMAQAIDVDNADGEWSNGRNASGNTPTCYEERNTSSDPTNENQVRYGQPANSSGCGFFSNRSGFGFDGVAPPSQSENLGQPFLLGQFTHYNNPIRFSTGMELVDLTIDLQLSQSGTPVAGIPPLVYEFTLEETPNNPNDNPGNQCPYPTPSGEGCTDRVTVDSSPPADQVFFIGGQEYTLQILGFVPGTDDTCVYDPNQTVVEFITREAQQNDACLFARIIEVDRDWGDAPDSYSTSNGQNGPVHTIVDNLKLGTEIDEEANGQPTADATGDDVNGATPDDEDGLVEAFVQPLPGADYPVKVSVNNSTGNEAFLCGWIDWPTNGVDPAGNGQFDESERVCVSTNDAACTATGSGTFECTLDFVAPTTLISGQTVDTFLRLRLGSELAEVNVPTGAARNGEVEDHRVNVISLAVTIGYVNASRTGGQVDFSWQTVTETGTAGFNIVTDGAPLNAELIPSTVVDSVVPTDYSFSAVTDADVYYLEEVSVDGKVSQMGPYEVGVEYGSYVATDAVVPAIYLPLMQR